MVNAFDQWEWCFCRLDYVFYYSFALQNFSCAYLDSSPITLTAKSVLLEDSFWDWKVWDWKYIHLLWFLTSSLHFEWTFMVTGVLISSLLVVCIATTICHIQPCIRILLSVEWRIRKICCLVWWFPWILRLILWLGLWSWMLRWCILINLKSPIWWFGPLFTAFDS
jgi:hypothetical protein